LQLELGGQLPVSGVGTGPDPVARIVANTDLAVGKVQVDGLSLVYLPLDSIAFFADFDEVYFDGVIGAQFFERFIVEIDYDRQLISFSEPTSEAGKALRLAGDWREIPLQIESGVPYLSTQVSTAAGQSVVVKLLVDTGYRGPVSLTPQTHAEIDPPREYFSLISQGISGDVESRVGPSGALGRGDFQLGNVPLHYSMAGGEDDNGANGLLGNEVLSRFNLVFDYPGERLFVIPNQRYVVPIGADRSGLHIRPHRLGAVVKYIAEDSAAGRSELEVDDIVTRIDSKPITRSNFTNLKHLLSSERETLTLCWLSHDGASQETAEEVNKEMSAGVGEEAGEETRCQDLALASRVVDQGI
jgi:hypothetical protein